MVDIVKSLPNVPTSFSSNIYNLRSKPFCKKKKLPKCLPNTNEISLTDRLNNIHTKRWIGNCPANPSRLLDVSKTPYSIHRKIMYQELSQQFPSTVDVSRSAKSKQQRNTSKDTTKITTASTTTLGSEQTNITSQPSFSYSDAQSSRLFDRLSKHVTVKAEPLRPSNNLTNNAANTLTSWQRYWTSTHVQRRRKEANDREPILYRPKYEQPTQGQTHFVVLRSTPYPYTELYQDDNEKPSTPSKISSPTKQYTSSPTPEKQFSSTKDDNITKATNQVFTVSTIECVTSSLLPSSFEINPSTNLPRTSTIIPSKSTDKGDEKYFTDKSLSLSPSSYFKSDSQIIEDVSQAQSRSKPIITKLYRFPLPSAKPKTRKKSPSTGRSQSKSVEKKQTRPSSASKQTRQISTNPKSVLSSVITTKSISKYSQEKWFEPYVGLRFDPPTPPCSPSLFPWLQDSDTSFEQSKFFEHNLTVEILDS